MTGTRTEECGLEGDSYGLPIHVDVEYVRDSFPGLRGATFLDHAAASPLPRPSIDALVAAAQQLGNPGQVDSLEYADRLRIEIAQLIKGDPAGVAITRSVAHGIALLSNGLDIQPGDNVVVVDGDYPATRYPWMAQQKRAGLEVRHVRTGNTAVTPDLILDMTDEQTRVVCLAEVMFITGYRIDLTTIGAECRKRGILFCVDGMQSIGAFDIDVVASNIDLLSSGGVKWLLGPSGVSFCWMRNDLVQQLPPLIPGALTVKDRMDFTNINPVWAHDAHRFEETWLAAPEMVALETSIKIAQRVGLTNIEPLVRQNVKTLASKLVNMGAELQGPWPRSDQELSGIVSFVHHGATAQQIGTELTRAHVRFSQRGNSIRLSPHYYNTRDDLDRALEAIQKAIYRS